MHGSFLFMYRQQELQKLWDNIFFFFYNYVFITSLGSGMKIFFFFLILLYLYSEITYSL